ncbi:MAG: DUF1538 domain-containing protein [Treponema sp.]|nr:DUF1538 domain-containing protein [Treponema sp.]
MNFFEKLKETASSVLPVMVIVLVLGVTIVPLGKAILVRFMMGGFLLIFGLTLFLAGVDLGILPVGERCGAALTAKRNLAILLGVSFLIGVMVTIAEPDVQVLADQIKAVSSSVSKWTLIFMIAAGIGLFVVVGLLRTMLSLKLKYVLIVAYIGVFMLAFLCSKEFQGVAFDAGGATTGPMTVPFIMALGVGVAAVRSKGQHSNSHADSSEDSFGLTGIASIGPIAAVCAYGIFLKGASALSCGQMEAASQPVSSVQESNGLNLRIFIDLFPEELKEVSMALLPLVLMFAAFQLFLLRMPPVQFRRVLKGLAYSYVGLVIFLTGVNGGFMPAGQKLGLVLGERACDAGGIWVALLTVTGVIFGAVVVCAEPAVWVLTEQVEQVSGGTIRRKAMLFALSAGVAISIGLSMLRIMYGFSLWYVLVPGYLAALALSLFCPPMFVGIAFDSGGVASGPMTSTFILSFTLGAAAAAGGSSATDAFGVIALVAMTPLIAIQMLGLVFKIKSKKEVS